MIAMTQALVLNFPIQRALGLPNIFLAEENVYMQPRDLFSSAIQNKDYAQAIRLVSSAKELQTRPNFLACCKDSASAFDLLRLVPASRKVVAIVELAASETRVARLVAEDLPELASELVLRSAINGEQAWADRYKQKFNLSANAIKRLMSDNSVRKSRPDAGISV